MSIGQFTRLDWNLARAFDATAACGSLSAAARRLGLTQPTLSRQIAALEQSLGITLFERVGKRLVLTEAGAGLIEPARAMAAAADAMALAAAGNALGMAGRVSISATDAVSAYLLPDIVARIRRAAPQITLVIVATNTISDLRRREADIAIRHVRPTEPNLIARRVLETTAHFYASEAYLAARSPIRSLDDLCSADMVGFEPAEGFLEHLQRAGFPVQADRLSILSENAAVMWEMVRRGLGVGIMLRQIADRTPDVRRLLPETPGTPVPVWLVSHRELRTNPRVRLVFETLAEELARL